MVASIKIHLYVFSVNKTYWVNKNILRWVNDKFHPKTSKMELFAKIVNWQKTINIFAEGSILHVWLCSECICTDIAMAIPL